MTSLDPATERKIRALLSSTPIIPVSDATYRANRAQRQREAESISPHKLWEEVRHTISGGALDSAIILTHRVQELKEYINDYPATIYTETAVLNAWNDTAGIVKSYSDELIEQWNKRIDGLLTFVCRSFQFAILTAFNVHSYPLLQQSPANDSNAILAQISAQLASFSVNPTFFNSTQPAFDSRSSQPFKAPLYAIWLNCLWFASLVFSIAAASIGIMVKQWLKEYSTGLYGTSREIARRRQYRLNNLEKWKVAAIVAALPVLLLVALILFLAGLVILTHNIHRTVSIVVSFLVALLLLFFFATAVLPAIFDGCSYRSPQAYLTFIVFKKLRFLVLALYSALYSSLYVSSLNRLSSLYPRSKSLSDACRAAREIVRRLHQLCHRPHIWRGDERLAAVDGSELDAHMIMMAFFTPFDTRAFDAAEACIAGAGDVRLAAAYLGGVSNRLTRYWGDEWPQKVLERFRRLELCTNPMVLAAKADEEGVKEKDGVLHSLAVISTRLDNHSLWPIAHATWKTLTWACNIIDLSPAMKVELAPIVSAAALTRLLAFNQSRYTHPGVIHVDVLLTYWKNLRPAIKAVAWQVPDPSAPDIQAACTSVGRALTLLEELLGAPQWRTEARVREPAELYEYSLVLEAVEEMCGYAHTRAVLAAVPGLMGVLEMGLKDIAWAEAERCTLEQRTDFDDGCRRVLQRIREKMEAGM